MENFECNVTKCVICHKDFESNQPVTVTEKGIASIRASALIYGDECLIQYLDSSPVKVNVHAQCRKNYTRKRSIDRFKEAKQDNSSEEDSCKKPKLRSQSSEVFQYKTHCVYCGLLALDKKNPYRYKCCFVKTLTIGNSIRETCEIRGHDSRSQEVLSRLQCCNDLFAEDALYHKSCHDNFHLGKASAAKLMPRNFSQTSSSSTSATTQRRNSGVYEAKQASFELVCNWLESQTERYLYSVSELIEKLKSFGFSDDDIYSARWMKRKLEEHYGQHITFVEHEGRPDVVCLTGMAAFILRHQWQRDQISDDVSESTQIITAAGKILRAELREFNYSKDFYPGEQEISDAEEAKKLIPPLLYLLMENLVNDVVKHVAICNAIIQAARPRSAISPILLGIGVQMDHCFGSKWLVDELAKLGFSISSDEIYRYKQSVLNAEPCEVNPDSMYPTRFTQWIGDNVDHNVASLDGKGSFHGMGIISVSSKCDKTFSDIRLSAVKRLQKVSAIEVVKTHRFSITEYMAPDEKALSILTIREMRELEHSHSTVTFAQQLDLIWSAGLSFCKPEGTHPSWSGYMQCVATNITEIHNVKSDITLLPIVDLSPSDPTCIYSTLTYIVNQAKQLNICTPCVTFDQPLWLKAVEICQASSLNIVCRLGGFHMLMNFVGSLGDVMEGSGFAAALEQCYGSNTVTHMMTGKAISRALRGYFLIDSALSAILLKKLTTDSSESQVNYSEEDRAELIRLHKGLLDETTDTVPSSISSSSSVQKLLDIIKKLKQQLQEHSRTAKLWLQFMYHMETIRLFIGAKRMNNWSLHLYATSRMLHLFAATGHFNYAKCTRLYLQMMEDLPSKHPWLYEQFNKYGFQSVRRSDRAWAGIWTDLAIEQILMRSLKTHGGLTRGRGFTESVRLTWVYTMHQCAGIHQAMTSLTGLHNITSEQHVELRPSRVKHDIADIDKLITWFSIHNPFVFHDASLRCISTGLMAVDGDGINCDSAEEVGRILQRNMTGLLFTNIQLKKKATVKTLINLHKGVTIDNKVVHMKNENLFNRLIVLAERNADMDKVFAFELTPIPSSLFDSALMRKSNKAALGRILSKDAFCDGIAQTWYILDGGALLHRVRWMKDQKYLQICQQYIDYIIRKYGRHVTVVFDGYFSGPSTKDPEHKRRSGKVTPSIQVSEEVLASSAQTQFLANSENKAQFIDLLMKYIKNNAMDVVQAPGDADTLIVKRAVELASNLQHVTVVADDTDILVLLTYHWNSSMAPILMRRESRVAHQSRTHLKGEKSTEAGIMDAKVNKSGCSFISISQVQQQIGETARKNLLVIHALSGCDTTSALYGHAKSMAFKKFSVAEASHDCHVLSDSCHKDDISKAGCRLIVLLYGGIPNEDTLGKMRYRTYTKLCSTTKSAVLPHLLPPTERAAYFHCLRVHLQVAEWKSLKTNVLDPCLWGWKLNNEGQLEPITTDLEPAPAELLQVIRCRCKTTSKNTCGTTMCSCKRNGIPCVSACSNCNGVDCSNCQKNVTTDNGFELEDEDQIYMYIDDDLPWVAEEQIEVVDKQESETVEFFFFEDGDIPFDREEDIWI